MGDKTYTPIVDQVKASIKAEKEKHKGKSWDDFSAKEKDHFLYLLTKLGGVIDKDTPES